MSKFIFVLGRQPEISLVELRAVFPRASFYSSGEVALAKNLEKSEVDLRRLGGVVKFAEVFAETKKWDDSDVFAFLKKEFSDRDGKQNFGVSCYGLRRDAAKTLLVGAKKFLRSHEISSRFANKNFKNLSSAAVEKEGLLKNGVEIIATKVGGEFVFARTLAVQPFDEFRSRDFEKAVRDARVGMLPPKLAIVLLNLAVHDKKNLRVFDPFCGSGTILVEAALAGHTPLGADLEPRMIEAAKANLAQHAFSAELAVRDARTPSEVAADVVVSEGWLGPPLKNLPDLAEREKTFRLLAEIHGELFGWLSVSRAVICLPVYLENGKEKFFASETVLPAIARRGWKKSNPRIVYARREQIVGREIIVLEKL